MRVATRSMVSYVQVVVLLLASVRVRLFPFASNVKVVCPPSESMTLFTWLRTVYSYLVVPPAGLMTRNKRPAASK